MKLLYEKLGTEGYRFNSKVVRFNVSVRLQKNLTIICFNSNVVRFNAKDSGQSSSCLFVSIPKWCDSMTFEIYALPVKTGFNSKVVRFNVE